MIKLYKKTLLLGALIGYISFFSGCDNNINLEPDGIITAENFFNSSEDFEKILNATYNKLNFDNKNLWFDAVTDNGLVTHSWNRGYDFGRGIANTTSAFSKQIWNNNYVSVQRANTIINNIDRYNWPNGKDDKDRNRILGEAKTLRAYFYTDLVTVFGHIMFYTENPKNVEESRSIKQIDNPKEVFDFLLKDLEEAITGLPEQSINKSKIGKPAARLLRARIAAYAAGYLKDKSYFEIVLSETEKLLETVPVLGEYGKLFKSGCENIDEVILVRTYSMDSKNGWGEMYNQSLSGYCVTTPVKSLVDSYEYIDTKQDKMPYLNKDPRFYETIYAPGMELENRGKYFNSIPNNVVEKGGKYYFDPSKDYGSLQEKEVSVGDVLGEGGGGEWNKTPTGFAWKKYCTEPETWSTYNSFIIFRYAEVYLLRAEALVETGGDKEEAKSLVQVIRDRAGNTNGIDYVLKHIYEGSLLNLIRNEIRVEFAQEGLRFYDLRRWNILLKQMNEPIEGIEYNDYSKVEPVKCIYKPAVREIYSERDFWWPIPQEEIDLNKDFIIQNSGW